MAEKIKCPYCDRAFDIDTVDETGLWQDRASLAARLGKCWHLANEYIDAFRRRPEGRIALKTRVRHLSSLAQLWETCVFEFDGKRYRTDQANVLEALGTVCNRSLTGLENHNYLKKVLLGRAERLSAEGLTSTEEQRIEQDRQTRLFDRKLEAEEEPLPVTEVKKRFGELADKIGSKVL